MDSLKEILVNKAPAIKTLPILHSCEAVNVKEILESSQLKTSPCKVFNEDYLYAFYGIPSYRKSGDSATANPGYLPVCFIFDYDKIPDLDRLYPCDSGAFSKLESIKKKHFHNSVKLNNLELEPNIDEAKKVIDFFYQNNSNYIRHRPKKTTDDIDAIHTCAWGYTSLINDKSATQYDNRVATIELIFKNIIAINDENLIQIILPAIFLDSEKIEDLITSQYQIANPMTYETIKGSPNENFGIVYNLYLNYLRQNSLT